MNVEIGAEAAQFPEKEYLIGIAVAVHVLFRMFFKAPRCEPGGVKPRVKGCTLAAVGFQITCF
jgi:hypothetical protein